MVGVFQLAGGLSFCRWSVVSGQRPVVSYAYGRWSVVFMVGAIGGRWSVSVSVGGPCFMFLMVGGQLFFRQWLVVGGTRSVVGGWSVGGGFALPLTFIMCGEFQDFIYHF